MNPTESKRFKKLYQRHLRLLKLQGKSKKTIEAYSRAVRRVSDHFDCCPDKLTPQQLEIFFLCVSSTLKDFGLNPKNLGAQIGMIMVLHTHNRRLDFHPHMHVVVPGGGVVKPRRQWKKNAVSGTIDFACCY